MASTNFTTKPLRLFMMYKSRDNIMFRMLQTILREIEGVIRAFQVDEVKHTLHEWPYSMSEHL
jgi:hypothetical protein